MAQTVALDYCEVLVNRMLESFMTVNKKIEETGNFDQLKAKDLYKIVASNNTVISNVLSRLGIFEGSDAAWENADYSDTWEGLRKDFELDNRFKGNNNVSSSSTVLALSFFFVIYCSFSCCQISLSS